MYNSSLFLSIWETDEKNMLWILYFELLTSCSRRLKRPYPFLMTRMARCWVLTVRSNQFRGTRYLQHSVRRLLLVPSRDRSVSIGALRHSIALGAYY